MFALCLYSGRHHKEVKTLHTLDLPMRNHVWNFEPDQDIAQAYMYTYREVALIESKSATEICDSIFNWTSSGHVRNSCVAACGAAPWAPISASAAEG